MKLKSLQTVKAVFLLSIIALIASCNFQIDPVTYNDALIDIQREAYEVRDEFDAKFGDPYWENEDSELYGAYDSDEYKELTEEYKQKFIDLIAKIDAVEDRKLDNEMKTTLKQLLQFSHDAIDNYYTAILLDYFQADGEKMGEIEDVYNEGFAEKEDTFLDAQKTFAADNNMNLF